MDSQPAVKKIGPLSVVTASWAAPLSNSQKEDTAAALVLTDATGKRDCWNESALQLVSGLLHWASDATGFYE